jgi:heptaprenyl diphosphate synthase
VGLTDEQFSAWLSAQSNRVEQRLRSACHTPDNFVEEAAVYLIDQGGKRFRPALVLAVAGLGLEADRVDQDAMIDAAVVVELTHVASLYHDDVMDEAELRRGAPAAHQRWGNSVAILVGDFLLAQASQIGAPLGEAFMVYQAQTLARLVQGQIAETRGPDNGVDPIEHHLHVISGKTASLIGAAARFGAMYAGLSADQIETLTTFGTSLGMAFQLADDLLDIGGGELGKRPGTDLREGVPTLTTLLIKRAKRPEDARLLELLAGPVADADLTEALGLLADHPALEQAREQVRQWAEAARGCLLGLPEGPAQRALQQLCDSAADRIA